MGKVGLFSDPITWKLSWSLYFGKEYLYIGTVAPRDGAPSITGYPLPELSYSMIGSKKESTHQVYGIQKDLFGSWSDFSGNSGSRSISCLHLPVLYK